MSVTYLAGADCVTNFQRINLQIQVLVFNKTVDSIGKNTLQVALAWSAPGISCHHSGDRRVCP